MAMDREINCPSAGKSVPAYREVGMSASNRCFALPGGGGCLSGLTSVRPAACWLVFAGVWF